MSPNWSLYFVLLFICQQAADGEETINIARSATLDVSSTLSFDNFNYNKENAVDGKTGTDANGCNCCYASALERSPWFEAKFAGPVDILKIILKGRIDTFAESSILSNIKVYLDGVDSPVRYNGTINNVDIFPNVPVQTIRVERPYTSSGNGWYLMICELIVNLGTNLIQSLRHMVTTEMSSVWSNHNSSLAVDGRIDTDANSFAVCKCCSVTTGNDRPWWRIDLDELYLIKAVYIIGRQRGSSEQSTDLHCFIKNHTDTSNGSLLTNNLGTNILYLYIFQQPRVFQTLSVERWTNSIITLCEVQMMEGECTVGAFGDICSRNCHCKDTLPCNKISGRCNTTGCLPGWTGESCDTACTHGRFGENCAQQCYCYNNADCNDETGVCNNHLCAPGWRTESCSEECGPRTFGLNCSSICHCRDGSSCNNVNGTCDNGLCEDGWRTESCSKECEFRTFGMNCSQTCHCLNNTACNNMNGICDIGHCDPGWETESCSSEWQDPFLFGVA